MRQNYQKIILVFTLLVSVQLKADPLIPTTDHNELAVSEQLGSITHFTAAESTLLTNLGTLHPFEKRVILNQMSGSQYVELQAAAESTSRGFVRRLYDPLRPIITADVVSDPLDGCYGVWLAGSGERSFFHGDHRAFGYNSYGYAVSGGFQANYCVDFTFGAALSYDCQHYKFSIGDSSGHRSDILGAVYALYRPVDFYVLTDIVFGASRDRVRRSFSIGTTDYHASSHPKNFEGTYYLESGFDYFWKYNCKPVLIQPFLGLEAGYYYFNGFTEKGTEPILLNLHAKYCTTFVTRMGAHFSTTYQCGALLSIDAAWQYRWTNLQNKRMANFVDFGSEYNLHGTGINRNAFDATINIMQPVDQIWSAYATAWVQTWANMTSCSFTLGLTADW